VNSECPSKLSTPSTAVAHCPEPGLPRRTLHARSPCHSVHRPHRIASGVHRGSARTGLCATLTRASGARAGRCVSLAVAAGAGASPPSPRSKPLDVPARKKVCADHERADATCSQGMIPLLARLQVPEADPAPLQTHPVRVASNPPPSANPQPPTCLGALPLPLPGSPSRRCRVCASRPCGSTPRACC
jgi:hypothetical protein